MKKEEAIELAKIWFKNNGWTPFAYQLETWNAYLDGFCGMVNAPTGSGKTYSLIIPILLESFINQKVLAKKDNENGLRAIWVTPVKALAKEIKSSTQKAISGLGLDWTVDIRTGDTSTSVRNKQKNKPPEILITTPESLHVMLASKGYFKFFKSLQSVVVDEWHELLGSKRGVQVELALAHLKGFLPGLKIWGVSATIGNMEEALAVLFPQNFQTGNYKWIKAAIEKRLEVETIIPDEIETFPWAGHLGIKLIEKVLPIIERSKSTLIFTNTRSFCEIWYQQLLEISPDLAGVLAMHHSSLAHELRDWVENALHEGILKAVVCTSSLDLGVDFRPVETIIQIGSPKGIARFIQRAGRSGHQPGATSKIYFVPTHSLELLEGAALRQAILEKKIEHRIPYIRSIDVLIQFLLTLAVSEGFDGDQLFREVKTTFSFESLTPEEWNWIIRFITSGGESLGAYDEYRRVVREEGLFKVTDRNIASRHRLSIGTIVSDHDLMVKYVSGKRIGSIEASFIAQLKPGDTFWFSGRNLELVRIKGMEVQVRPSNQKSGKVPSWMGGRMSFSSELSAILRIKIDEFKGGASNDVELKALEPLKKIQETRSSVPSKNELLIEYFMTREGYHLVVYPFEGRFVHQGMAALIAYRISKTLPISFSIAMNDYGFELLSETKVTFDSYLVKNLFSTQSLSEDIRNSVNSIELARRGFREIASIAGLIFKGFPGKQKKDRHLQSSSELFFEVFQNYEPTNLLLQQAYDEAMNFQLEEGRLFNALERIQKQHILLEQPSKVTPFAFPILVDRLREKLTSEKLIDRVKKMKMNLEE